MPVFYCEPWSGLGNRLMMMASSIRAAKLHGYQVIFVWRKEGDFYSEFGSLFENVNYTNTPPNMPMLELPGYPQRMCIDFEALAGQDFYLRNHHFVLCADDLKQAPSNAEWITEGLRDGWRDIVPTAAVREKLLHREFDLGVHVRRNGVVDTNDWNFPDDQTVANIVKNCVVATNAKSLYLCSPSNETIKSILSAIIGMGVEVTISGANSWDQDCAAVTQAYVDMLNLARCKHIVRRDISTFSGLPSLVNAQSEYIYTSEGGVLNKRPLIFSGGLL